MWPITAETAVIITVPRCTRGSSSDLSIPQHLKQTRIQYSHGPPGAFLLTQTYAKQKVLLSFLQGTRGLFSSHRRNIARYPQRFSPSALWEKKLTIYGTGATHAVKKVPSLKSFGCAEHLVLTNIISCHSTFPRLPLYLSWTCVSLLLLRDPEPSKNSLPEWKAKKSQTGRVRKPGYLTVNRFTNTNKQQQKTTTFQCIWKWPQNNESGFVWVFIFSSWDCDSDSAETSPGPFPKHMRDERSDDSPKCTK